MNDFRRFAWPGVLLGVLTALVASLLMRGTDGPDESSRPGAQGQRQLTGASSTRSVADLRASLPSATQADDPKDRMEDLREDRDPDRVLDDTPNPNVYFRVSRSDAGSDSPLEFTSAIPESYTPRGFGRIAQRAAKECGLGLEVVALDCSEFPCIAWTLARNDNVARFSMSGCSPWEDAFANGTVVVGSLELLDGGAGARYLSWMAVPPDPRDFQIAMRRARERTRGMAEALGQR